MANVLIAPRKYVQGKGIMTELGQYLKPIGKRALLVWDAAVKELVGAVVTASLTKAEVEFSAADFCGETTHAEADRLAKIIKDDACDMVIGIGGGKTLDAAKAAGAQAGAKFITVPTIASNDSPTSSYTVWYDEEGNCLGFESWGVNPELVFVDSQVIAQGPLKAFRAGMGDALATWIECRACHEGRSGNLAGGTATMVSLAIARLGFETLMEYGEQAVRCVEKGIVTPTVEKVIEANILMSGLGFESGGCATAHMVANCLPSYEECHGLMHGEEVAFGIVVQLCLEDNRPTEEIEAIVDFLIAIGLPVTLADIGLQGADRDRLRQIGDICASDGSLCGNHPFDVNAEDVVDAILAADALGNSRKF